jgi:hypothetical protein
MKQEDGSASLTLWRVFQSMSQRFPEIDMVGCNSAWRLQGGIRRDAEALLRRHSREKSSPVTSI